MNANNSSLKQNSFGVTLIVLFVILSAFFVFQFKQFDDAENGFYGYSFVDAEEDALTQFKDALQKFQFTFLSGHQRNKVGGQSILSPIFRGVVLFYARTRGGHSNYRVAIYQMTAPPNFHYLCPLHHRMYICTLSNVLEHIILDNVSVELIKLYIFFQIIIFIMFTIKKFQSILPLKYLIIVYLVQGSKQVFIPGTV